MTVEDFLSKSRFCSEDISVLIKIIRRQQDGLKKIADGYCRKDCDGVDACACDERTATQTLADCDAIVEGK